MNKAKFYHDVRFASNVIDEAVNSFLSFVAPDERTQGNEPNTVWVEFDGARWQYDTYAEFLADYPKSTSFKFDYIAKNYITKGEKGKRLIIDGSLVPNTVRVIVEMPTRAEIESVFGVFERHVPNSAVITEEKEPIKIFVGHGHSSQWRDLKDHLREQHGFDVVAYEVGPRAGRTIKEVLEQMLTVSSFALLVLTGEDEDSEGQLHARENVIHEAGLFQGALGFRRAIVLLEQGCVEFSNIHGLDQIRFSRGNIRETFGDVLATIKREFQDGDD